MRKKKRRSLENEAGMVSIETMRLSNETVEPFAVSRLESAVVEGVY